MFLKNIYNIIKIGSKHKNTFIEPKYFFKLSSEMIISIINNTNSKAIKNIELVTNNIKIKNNIISIFAEVFISFKILLDISIHILY